MDLAWRLLQKMHGRFLGPQPAVHCTARPPIWLIITALCVKAAPPPAIATTAALQRSRFLHSDTRHLAVGRAAAPTTPGHRASRKKGEESRNRTEISTFLFLFFSVPIFFHFFFSSSTLYTSLLRSLVTPPCGSCPVQLAQVAPHSFRFRALRPCARHLHSEPAWVLPCCRHRDHETLQEAERRSTAGRCRRRRRPGVEALVSWPVAGFPQGHRGIAWLEASGGAAIPSSPCSSLPALPCADGVPAPRWLTARDNALTGTGQ